ncbi:MAG: hypothetical protein QOI93_5871 [Rhodospirillaceae bacterium]|nr:hypothetical protein [Rhodospirillaceae bacterium]
MRRPERKALLAFYWGTAMEESLLNKAFRLAPLTSAAGIAYGLEHAPKFTINLLNGLFFAAATDYHAQLEDQAFAHRLSALMATCGPWRYGPETASQSRASLERLPATDPAVTLLDPYYFDHTMVYFDDGYREGNSQLFTHAYRLHPCGVFALNYDPRIDDDSTLVESAICIAFLRGSDLWGKAFLFNAMWQEGLPLGQSCAFEMPRWGLLRRAVAAEGVNPILLMLQSLCEQAVTTGAATRPEVEVVIRRCGGAESLPTPVERGFPNLVRTVWFGAEPFPALDFELQLIGADFRQRKVSVPPWFRPSRAEFAGTGR